MNGRFRRWKDGGIRELARDDGEGGKDDGNSPGRSAPPERDDVGEPGEMQGMLLWESDLLVRELCGADCDQENENWIASFRSAQPWKMLEVASIQCRLSLERMFPYQ